MTERPEALRRRRGRSMQDSGVSSFGSESDSSPVQQHGTVQTADTAVDGRTAVSANLSTPATMYGNEHTGFTGHQISHHRSGNPTIAVIPQSPQCDRTKTFIYDSVPTKPDHHHGRDAKTADTGTGDGTFHVTYYGESALDRRYTRPMLPWIMAEIRRRSIKHELILEILPSGHILQGRLRTTSEVIFRHRLPTVSSFARAYQDPTCFVYLTRTNVDSPFICHVFQVSEESKVIIMHDYDDGCGLQIIIYYNIRLLDLMHFDTKLLVHALNAN
ncbi:hypothetical protein LSH36_14g11022 [Paralvinella palmiformis]|uniref:PID domain-containing protein n=1 Tax=Paralvinella palmiformis TaxID=53620 RepID=A0AAD9KBT8_9ANNE|nr:hypothetical protein LSH36_14g11022 [Paralvinella palmiformis]